MITKQNKILKVTLQVFIIIVLVGMLLTTSSCGKKDNNENLDNNDGNISEIPDEPTDGDKTPSVDPDFPNNNDNPDLPNENDDPFVDITEPTIIVTGSTVKPGDKNIEVTIEIKNNPGILGIDFELYYDDTTLELVGAKSTLDLEGCNYTKPSYYRNPTAFLWDFQDSNWVDDGIILKCYFDVLETASVGEYEIKIMYSHGNIFNEDGNPIYLEIKNSYITIKE